MPILETRCDGKPVPTWTPKRHKVVLAKRVTLEAKYEHIVLANCDVPGLVLMSPNARMHQRHQVTLANGLASVYHNQPLHVRLCNVGPVRCILKKGSVVGYAETYSGPVVATVDKPPTPPPIDDNPTPSINDVDLTDAPKNLHKKIRTMLDKHRSMWDGTLGTIRATTHRIETPANASPVHEASIRTGIRKREIITDCIYSMLKQHVVKASHSE